MKTFFSEHQLLHAPAHEFNRGTYGKPFEHGGRVESVLSALKTAGLSPIEPAQFPRSHITRVHDDAYVSFLQSAYAEWLALGRDGEALPICWPYRGSEDSPPPTSLDGRLGYYSFDIMTPITASTWDAVIGSANTVLGAATVIANGNARAAFSLCRPPGHHAGANTYGGYCFLNSAAIAAQFLRDTGAAKVAVLDVDYHHGNGTQEIFYARDDVLYVSLHADPKSDFPYFSGHRGETGHGQGAGFNLNLPLPRGTQWPAWSTAFNDGARVINAFKPDAVVVSLGIDNLEGDPLSHFNFQVDDYARIGQCIAQLALPTLFVFEGGYLIEKIGDGVVRTLQGFEGL